MPRSACLELFSALSLFPLDSVTDPLANVFSLVHTGLDFKESSIWNLARILKSWEFAVKSGFWLLWRCWWMMWCLLSTGVTTPLRDVAGSLSSDLTLPA